MAADFWKNPVGSGPCTFISEISGSELQLGAFADYHMGAPKFGKLVIKVIANTNTVTELLVHREGDGLTDPLVGDVLVVDDEGDKARGGAGLGHVHTAEALGGQGVVRHPAEPGRGRHQGGHPDR